MYSYSINYKYIVVDDTFTVYESDIITWTKQGILKNKLYECAINSLKYDYNIDNVVMDDLMVYV